MSKRTWAAEVEYQHLVATPPPDPDPFRSPDCTCPQGCVWCGSWAPVFDPNWGVWNLVSVA